MKSVRAVPLNSTGPVSGPFEPEFQSRDTYMYVLQLLKAMEVAHNNLKNQQREIRTQDIQEPPLVQVGDKVWLRRKRASRHKSP